MSGAQKKAEARRRVTDAVVRKMSSVVRVALISAMCLLAAMMLMTTVNVAMRYLANAPILGAYEIISLLLVCLTAAALGYCQLEKGNIRVSIILDRLPWRGQAILDSLASLVGLGGIGLVCWYAFLRAKKYIFLTRGEVTNILGIPYYPFMFILFIGFALLALVLIINLVQSVDRAMKE